MARFLLIFLTFLLITATAALIGTEAPTNDVVISKDNVPVKEESSREEVKTLDDPPRFIPDEEIYDDPSAWEKEREDAEDETAAKTPTEREIKKTSQPFILEIMSIKENAFANLASMEKKIAVDYLSLPQGERADAPQNLTEKYLPAAKMLMETADKDVERALKKMEAALSAINAPLDTVSEAEKSYAAEREKTLSSYTELLKSLGQDIDLDEILPY